MPNPVGTGGAQPAHHLQDQYPVGDENSDDECPAPESRHGGKPSLNNGVEDIPDATQSQASQKLYYAILSWANDADAKTPAQRAARQKIAVGFEPGYTDMPSTLSFGGCNVKTLPAWLEQIPRLTLLDLRQNKEIESLPDFARRFPTRLHADTWRKREAISNQVLRWAGEKHVTVSYHPSGESGPSLPLPSTVPYPGLNGPVEQAEQQECNQTAGPSRTAAAGEAVAPVEGPLDTVPAVPVAAAPHDTAAVRAAAAPNDTAVAGEAVAPVEGPHDTVPAVPATAAPDDTAAVPAAAAPDDTSALPVPEAPHQTAAAVPAAASSHETAAAAPASALPHEAAAAATHPGTVESTPNPLRDPLLDQLGSAYETLRDANGNHQRALETLRDATNSLLSRYEQGARKRARHEANVHDRLINNLTWQKNSHLGQRRGMGAVAAAFRLGFRVGIRETARQLRKNLPRWLTLGIFGRKKKWGKFENSDKGYTTTRYRDSSTRKTIFGAGAIDLSRIKGLFSGANRCYGQPRPILGANTDQRLSHAVWGCAVFQLMNLDPENSTDNTRQTQHLEKLKKRLVKIDPEQNVLWEKFEQTIKEMLALKGNLSRFWPPADPRNRPPDDPYPNVEKWSRTLLEVTQAIKRSCLTNSDVSPRLRAEARAEKELDNMLAMLDLLGFQGAAFREVGAKSQLIVGPPKFGQAGAAPVESEGIPKGDGDDGDDAGDPAALPAAVLASHANAMIMNLGDLSRGIPEAPVIMITKVGEEMRFELAVPTRNLPIAAAAAAA